jgi:radical SAM protein with 4Fe4S-binding SPASM domain
LLRKTFNLCLAGYSYLKTSVTGNPVISGLPVSLGIELTNNCNLKCPECVSGSGTMTRKKGYMQPELFDKIIRETGDYLYNINLFFQGEPMLHPLFFSFLERCRNINSVVSTNGHFLNEENSEKLVRSGLKKLIISLDGMDQGTYSSYRINGDLNTVLDGIRNVTKIRDRSNSALKIELQFLVNRLNEKQVEDVRRFAKSVHAGIKLKSMQVYSNDSMDYWLPADEHFRRYKNTDGIFSIKNDLKNRCLRMWFNPVVTWDGKVVPCCFDKDAEHVLGDLNTDTFMDIWNGPKYRVFRKQIFMGRDTIEICRNCTSGLRLRSV